MSLKKRLYSSPQKKKWAYIAVVSSVIFIPFPPEVVIPSIFALSGSKLLAFSIMSFQSICYILYYSACVRLLLFEDKKFFRTHKIGKMIFKSISRMRKLARKKPGGHWAKEIFRLFLALLLSITPGTLTLAVVFPILVPKPRYYIACMLGITMRCAVVTGFADEITHFFFTLFS